ncbi:MAG: hypothetical protein MUP03_08110 [Anaerolineales bacterium]|nr:hypothetical protein [Anaerolineales bacterium]
MAKYNSLLKKFLVIFSVLFILALSLPQRAYASSAWYDGSIEYSTILNCWSIINGTPYYENGAGTYVGYIADPTAGQPEPNTTYYVHVVIYGLGNSCSGMYAYIDIGLPANTALAINSTDKVYCFYDGGLIPDAECPQSLPASSYNTGMYKVPSINPNQTWPIPQGHNLEIQIPVRSTTPLSGSNFQAAVWMLDGNDSPWLNPTRGVSVYANPHTISGNAGAPGVTLSYTDGSLKTATSNGSGNYSFQVSYGWNGTVTPSKTGVSFIPSSRTYTGVISDQTGQNYVAKIDKTFTSAGALDGWVLESTENSNQGGSLNATATTFQLGDNAADRQYKAVLSFNTASLPDTIIIQSAVIKIKQSGMPTGSNPFNILGNLWVDISTGWFGTSSALALTDFNAAASAAKVGTFNKIPAGGWYSMTLNATGRSNINKIGLTQFRLYFGKDDNDDMSADFMKFFSGNAVSGKPQLIITYTLP